MSPNAPPAFHFVERLKFLFRITENRARVDPILEVVGGHGPGGRLVGFAGWRLIDSVRYSVLAI